MNIAQQLHSTELHGQATICGSSSISGVSLCYISDDLCVQSLESCHAQQVVEASSNTVLVVRARNVHAGRICW